MKIVSYAAHNVCRVEDIKFNMAGHNLFLVGGKNAQGKTSAINALLMALCGRSGMDYPEPALKDGAKEGWVKVTLTGDPSLMEDSHLTVEVLLTRKRNGAVAEKFRLLDSAGEEAPSPRRLLKDLYKTKGFDPLAFDKMDKKVRRETLMEMVGLDLEQFKKDRAALYQKRRDKNRDVEGAKARLDALGPMDLEIPAEPIDLTKFAEEAKEIEEYNNKITLNDQMLTSIVSALESKKREIADFERKISEMIAEKNELKAAETKMLETQQEAIQMRERLGEKRDPAEVMTKVQEANKINDKIKNNKEIQAAQVVANELEAESMTLTQAIEKLDHEQDEAIRTASWPVPGMKVDEEGVLLNDLPYESASKSERVRASTRMGIAMNPKLRLLVCEDGSDLDNDTIKELDKLLKDEDFQMLCEIVTRGQDDENLCAVVIEDGRVKEAGE